MTPEIHNQFNDLKEFTDVIIPLLYTFNEKEFEAFERDAYSFASGTLDAVLPHMMSIRDMDASKENLTHAIEVSKTLRKLKSLLLREGTIEDALRQYA